ncbi:MAG: 1-acyl-sn-glycerol-3-phosphate acyltransferase [Chlorobiaceae bacterium]|nr:1-acyl-sn-glycerol-3-phosphate acyltransferase [Chlorobiaceae bacterium]
MSRVIDYLFRPLPFLSVGKALLLRTLMLPNLLFTSVEGEENLEMAALSPCIYAFNHNNVFESLFVPVLLIYLLGGRKVSFVIDWMFGRLPLIGWLLNQVEPVYVYHKRSILPFIERSRPKERFLSSMDRCIDKLASGTSIGIFPEGTRNGDPCQLLKAKAGIGYIALISGAQVLPVGIEFTTSSRRKRVPVVGRMVLRFGHPMCFTGLSETYRNASANCNKDEKRIIADKVTDEVMLAIAELCGKIYKDRRSYRKEFLQDNQSTEAICLL